MVQGHLCKNALLTHFSPIFGPKMAHFQGILGFSIGQECVTTGSKWAKNTCLSIPNGAPSLLKNCVFHTFLIHFWSSNYPFLRRFGIFHGRKGATTGSKQPRTLFWTSQVVRNKLQKNLFFAPGTFMDPWLGAAVRGLGCPPAAPSDDSYAGLRISLTDAKASKPQKMGVAGGLGALGIWF